MNRSQWIVGALFCLAASMAQGQQPPPATGGTGGTSSLDQQLLEGLDRELLEGLPGPTRPDAPRDRDAADRQRPGPAGLPAGEDLGASGESENPLAQIAARMRTVEARIAAGDTSAETLAAQEQILAQLAALLQQAQKQGAGQQQPGQGSGSGSSPRGEGSGEFMPGPVQDSTNRIERGMAEASEAADVKDVVSRLWGHLPDKLRSEMQASLSEQFLPKYERLIEQYYKRLAEEQPAGQ